MGTAWIARMNWKAILRSGRAVVTAVASRDPDRSRRFVEEMQAAAPFPTAPAALGSYEELLASPDVDAVYLPLPTGLRKEWVLRAAAAGKHVLCEKPCAVDVADLREMIAACRRRRVQFMDGVMFAHNPRLERIHEVLGDGQSVGRIKRITASFTTRVSDQWLLANIRSDSRLEPTGCLGDLGWYPIRFILYALDGRLPRAVTGRTLAQRKHRRSPAPVPTDFSGELIFDDDTSAGFYCSYATAYQHWAHVDGASGWLRVDDFVHAASDLESVFTVNGRTIRVKTGGGRPVKGETLAQPTNMIRNFARQIASGKLNHAWPDIALKTQQVVDACFRSAQAGGKLRKV